MLEACLPAALSPVLVCRPALPMDKPGVLAMVARIWDGHDYIPFVWDDWLAEAQGQMIVAEYGGRIVGLCRITWLTDCEWWLEGLRVHPDFSGRGFGRHLFHHCLGLWQQQGGQLIRLITGQTNVAVQRLCERAGFVRIGALAFYQAAALDDAPESLQPLAEADIPAAMALLERRAPLVYGLADYAWKWGAPSVDLLRRAASGGRAWWWRNGEGLLTFWEDEDDGKRLPLLQVAACAPHALPDYLADYRRLAGQQGYGRAQWMAPLDEAVTGSLLAAGFTAQAGEGVFFYEKRQTQADGERGK